MAPNSTAELFADPAKASAAAQSKPAALARELGTSLGRNHSQAEETASLRNLLKHRGCCVGSRKKGAELKHRGFWLAKTRRGKRRRTPCVMIALVWSLGTDAQTGRRSPRIEQLAVDLRMMQTAAERHVRRLSTPMAISKPLTASSSRIEGHGLIAHDSTPRELPSTSTCLQRVPFIISTAHFGSSALFLPLRQTVLILSMCTAINHSLHPTITLDTIPPPHSHQNQARSGASSSKVTTASAIDAYLPS
ncbi:hypothetical protein C8R44DRAFT_859587, partial [Mycena epipterygia]